VTTCDARGRRHVPGKAHETSSFIARFQGHYWGLASDLAHAACCPFLILWTRNTGKGVEHAVTVTAEGFEWQGRPYKSLSAIARAITGTRWNGLVFFGLKSRRART
jgi:hypothetical protein